MTSGMRSSPQATGTNAAHGLVWFSMVELLVWPPVHRIERRAAVSGPASYVNRPYNARSGIRAPVCGCLLILIAYIRSPCSEWVWEDFHTPVVTANLTTTTMIGLKPDTRYQFRFAAISENVVFSQQWLERDMYGRRQPTPGYVLGPFTTTAVVATLAHGTPCCLEACMVVW